jgi:septal ring factor EnvC (AmiA/AmiB activator)
VIARTAEAALLCTALLAATAAPGHAASEDDGARSAIRSLSELDAELLQADTELRSASLRARESEARLGQLESEQRALEEQLGERRSRTALRVRAMYRHRHRGFLPLLFSAEGPHELLLAARYLYWIVRADHRALREYQGELERRSELLLSVSRERKELLAVAGEAFERREEVRQIREDRETLLVRMPPERRQRARALLAESAPRQLDVSLDLRDEAPPLDLPAAAVEPDGTAFERGRGRLPMPAVGPVERAGRGIVIRAEAGKPIRAVADGRVARLLPIEGYGLVCILEHGDGWHSVYGHAEGWDVSPGEAVRSGQQLGRVGDSGSLDGPRLHFEVRRGREPEDALDWLALPSGVEVRDGR